MIDHEDVFDAFRNCITGDCSKCNYVDKDGKWICCGCNKEYQKIKDFNF